MKYRMLGRTGLYVSELSLGTMAFGGGSEFFRNIGNLDLQGAKDQIKYAFDAGINLVDTANYYSNGLSESLVGEAVAGLGLPRDELVIATKARLRVGQAPNSVGLTRSHLFAEVDKSLRRLKTDYIDLHLAHGFDALTPIDETLQAYADLVRMGKIRYVGACNFAAWQLMKALGVSESRGLVRLQAAQMYYSLASRDIEREVVPACLDQSVSIMAWSPLAGGYLSGKYRAGELGSAARRKTFPFPPVDESRGDACLRVLQAISERTGASCSQLALRYLLTRPAVGTVLVGARDLKQLQENIAAVDIELSEEDLAALDQASALTPEYPGWMLARQGADRAVGAGAISQLPRKS